MNRSLLATAILLASLTSAPVFGGHIAQFAIDGTRIRAPINVPLNLGDQPLGTISTVAVTLCFDDDATPDDCDGSGTVVGLQQLAPPFYQAGYFRETIATGLKTRIALPLELGAGERLRYFDQWISTTLGPAAGTHGVRITPAGESPEDIVVNFSGTGTLPGECPSLFDLGVLCLGDDRFKARVHFVTSTADQDMAHGLGLTRDTGYFFFFHPANVEAVIKVLDACAFNQRFWVFAGGLTDVRTVITVTDTQSNVVKTYFNPPGVAFHPVQDTSAFATCP
jgi:hypothetical protein